MFEVVIVYPFKYRMKKRSIRQALAEDLANRKIPFTLSCLKGRWYLFTTIDIAATAVFGTTQLPRELGITQC